MLQMVINAFKVKDIRKKLLFTLFMLFVIRIGSNIPVPGVNTDFFKNILDNAYKVVVMQEIMDYLLYDRTYTRTELNALLDGENILQQSYDEWLSFDGNLREVIEYPIEHLNEIIKEENEKNPNNNVRYSEEKNPKNEVR